MTQVIIHIEPDLKNKVKRLAGIEGKNVSQLMHGLLVKYIMERDMSTHREELDLKNLKQSANLYADLYDQNEELQELTETALQGWPE